MTRDGQSSPPPRGQAQVPGLRPDETLCEDRPFAEIRRNLNDLVRIISLHRWAFFVPFCLVTTAAFLLSLKYPRTYTAKTSFERRNDPLMADLPNQSRTHSFRIYQNTVERELTTAEGMAEVVDNLGLTAPFPRNPDGTLTTAGLQQRTSLARSLASTVSISTLSPTEHIDIIRLTYNGPDPSIGPKLLDETKRVYIRRSQAWMHDFLNRQRAYLEEEAQRASSELKAARREETAWRMANPHLNLQDPGTITAGLEDLQIKHRELLLQRREQESQLTALQQLLAGIETRSQALADQVLTATPGAVPVTAQLSEESVRLQRELDDLDGRIEKLRLERGMTDEHPEIRDLRLTRDAAFRALQRQRDLDHQWAQGGAAMSSSAATTAASVLAAVRPWEGENDRISTRIAAVRTELKKLDISLQTTEAEMDRLEQARKEVFERQEEYADVQSRVTIASNRHQQLLASIAQLEPAISAIEQGRMIQFSEGEPARGSHIPVNPKATTIILLAILAGVAAGTVFTVLAEVLDNVYRSSSEVARSLGLPILDSIDEIVTTADRRRRALLTTVISPLFVAGFLVVTVLAGAMAYLSIQEPATYRRMQKFRSAAVGCITDVGLQNLPDIHPVANAN